MDGVFFKFNSGRVTASLRSGESVLTEDVRFELEQGESLALIGETGSGKTMTALEIMGLLPPNVRALGRELVLEGEDISDLPPKELALLLGKKIVYIPQSGSEYLNPSRKIGKQLFDNLGSKDRGLAAEKLEMAGLADGEKYLDRYPFQLSGGQAQRVTIALALCGDPMLLIADEPTNGLDRKTRDAFLAGLDEHFPKAAKIIITHDIGAARCCKKIAVMRAGRIVEEGCCSEVLSAPKSGYTRALMDSLVENGMKHDI